MSRSARTRRRTLALLSLGAALTATGLTSLGPTGATASSHREAPGISKAPQFDNTDFYAFVSPDKPDTVTFVANWIPFEEPAGGPNFYPFADDGVYDINVDKDGDGRANATYRWTFFNSYRNKQTFLYNTGKVTSLDDPDLNFRQTYRLDLINRDTGRTTVLVNHAKVAPSNVGAASMPNYQALRDQAVTSVPGGIKSFAGQADDPFFLDLRVFDLLYGGDLSEVGNDTVAGYNVNTVALQVPIKELTQGGDPVFGAWTSTSRFSPTHHWVRVSRLGAPLVNEVVIPVQEKDHFNGSLPKDDAQFLKYVTSPEVPKLIQAIYGIKAPAEPRNDLVQVFLTGVPGLNQPKNVKPAEMLRLNTSIKPSANPKRLGVLEGDKAGYPNGRRLTDDVVDITLQVAEGELVGKPNDLGDAVNQNDAAFGQAFPYVALPTSGSATRPAASKSPGTATAKPSGAVAGGSRGGSQAASQGGSQLLNGGNSQPASSSSDSWAPVDVVLPAGLVGLGIACLIGGVYVLWRRYTVRA